MRYNSDMEQIGANIANIARNIEIVGADPITLHGFTQVPNFVLTQKDLSVGAKLAYAMLLKYAWGDQRRRNPFVSPFCEWLFAVS